ncbi:ABC transporter ATP-binding protein [Metaclostridioides mangenotii]|uniref:ABC-2 type transport system ATP-binding protein n=1 Tax=Metaclostridioides mangenotii TaxID=1540 RepID=A0ABS4E7K4_9FIRM|nr:ABC transporter ATP-binding protein [Clostridioides mangenotii]MBP1853925.1 ABC-2 type transport system ATP-binding protein [Clostridioides mangenotii]
MDAIKINNLSRKLGKFELEIDDLNIMSGFITGFIGPNGSGKTTTIKLIMNMIKKDSGSVKIFGKEFLEDDISIKSQIGYISDKPGFLEEAVLSDLKRNISRFYKNWDEGLYNSYIDEFDIDESNKYQSLSKGQQKKFELALVLSHHPKLIILDEPTANLDPLFRNRFLEILQERIDVDDSTVFLSTHITSDLDKVGDYVVFIYDGKIILSGVKDDILEKHCKIKGKKELLVSETRDLFIYIDENEFGFEGIVDDKNRSYDVFGNEVVYDTVNLEDILRFYVEARRYE